MSATERKEAKDGEPVLRQIVGARLTSVQFVLDYLILGFDERGALTTLVWPAIANSGSLHRLGMAGYRDGLCSFITQVVTSVAIDEAERITIGFSDGRELCIPLGEYELPGERAIFAGPNRVLYVW